MTKTLLLHSRICLSIILLASGCRSAPPELRQRIEQQALDAIDFDELEPVIRDFIELALEDMVLGRPISEFSEVLEHALETDNLDDGTRLHSYEFAPPMTEEFRTQQAESNGVVYWPMLMIRVDKETQTIDYVFVYLQGL